MRLIDADALEERFKYLATVGNDLVHKVTEEEKGMRVTYRLSKYETHMAPTIDPESLRVHGMWMPFYESDISGFNPEFAGCDPIAGYKCSKCGAEAIFDCNDQFVLSNYCPNSGAKMEKEKK